MKSSVLLYNFNSSFDEKTRNKIKFLCIKAGVQIRIVEENQYDMPLGLLAFGKKEDQAKYLRKEAGKTFTDPMLVFAGFSGNQIDTFLDGMRREKIPPISLKAMLTEHNAVWDSVTLHDEIEKEHRQLTSSKVSV